MSDYRRYLAASILTEQKAVTYRLLSRALKVHVNVAKEMLYEFYLHQNAKKPGTIHATYLISGSKPDEPAPEISNGKGLATDEDTYMQSSPFTCSPSSTQDDSTWKSPVQTITLVKEADLEKIRSAYDHIDSIHIYSIGLFPIKDLQVLSDVTSEIKQICSGENPLNSHSIYGTIKNVNVKLRSGSRLAVSSVPKSIVKSSVASKSLTNEKSVAVKINAEDKKTQLSSVPVPPNRAKVKSSASGVVNQTDSSAKNVSDQKVSQSKKHDPASIFSAFARTETKLKEKPKIVAPEKTAASEKNIVNNSEDSTMKNMSSDDDDNDDEVWASNQPVKKVSSENYKTRKEREEALKRMMDDDEDEAEAVLKKSTSTTASSEPKDTMLRKDSSQDKEQNVLESRKRRYRRRVMKKTTFKDEEGYLVTKEEPAWESFSEDEQVSKPTVVAQPPISSKQKKTVSGKSAQGSIMSFFGKKQV